MPTLTRTQLLPGVFLTAIHTEKFKSSMFSMTLLTPLRAERAATEALIPFLLLRGSETCPDMQSISARLDRLYGGSVSPVVRKKGEVHCLGLLGSFLADAYTLDGGGILAEAIQFTGELLLRPLTENGVFSRDYTRQEKDNLADRIRSEINDKRLYANRRVVEEMCRDEPYGVSALGRETDVAAITPEAAWACYREMLCHARLELYYCGSAAQDKVADLFLKALKDLPREGGYDLPRPLIPARADTVRQVEERMDVVQGKLAMGLRTGGITACDGDYPALLLCNAVFGGTATSKLFLHVREELSLCYYADSGLHKFKGLMLVSSGVEFDQRRRAEDEIMAQLEACRRGEIQLWEMDGARRSVASALRTVPDSQGRQEDWWLGQAVAGLDQSPEALARDLEQVDVARVVQAAQALSLDTVYFLKGMEG